MNALLKCISTVIHG